MRCTRLLALLLFTLPVAAMAGTTTYTYQGSAFDSVANHSTCALGTCFNYALTDRVTVHFHGLVP